MSGKPFRACWGGDWVRHVRREGNSLADSAVNECMNLGADFHTLFHPLPENHRYLCGSFDGGLRKASGVAASGWAIEFWDVVSGKWLLHSKSGYYEKTLTVTKAECTALQKLIGALNKIL